MKISSKQLADALGKIELKVEKREMQYYYVDHLDNTNIIKSELNPAEFLAKNNLKKSAIIK